MSKTKFSIIILIVVALVLVAGYFLFFNDKPVAIINGKKINLELAITPGQREIGLSGRDLLKANSGMLFIYDIYFRPGFWMKDMKFPLDIIWIKDNTIVGFEENASLSTDGQLPSYFAPEPINQVLEVNAGFVKKNDIKVGDNVIFKNLK